MTEETSFAPCPLSGSSERVILFFAFPPDVRKVIYTTNMIESINYRLRKITKTRGHFPLTTPGSSCSTSNAEKWAAPSEPAREGARTTTGRLL